MPLVNIPEMLDHASRHGYALAGFAVSSLDQLAAVIAAAEQCHGPVMLGVSQRNTPSAQLGALLAAAEHLARRATVPVGLRYDCATDRGTSEAAIRWGANGIAVDGTQLAWPEKLALTRQIGEMAGTCGIPIEGLIGFMPLDRNNQASSASKDDTSLSARAIREFVEQTGVGSLAFRLAPETDFQKIWDEVLQYLVSIRQAVSVPLVLYGADTLLPDDLRQLVAQGIAAVHFEARDNLQEYAQACMRASGCAEHATAVLAECQTWEPVEHVIVFNAETDGDLDIDRVLAEGRDVLSRIPGVRYVHTGQAITVGAAYQFCWLVQFVHAAVIDSYREHPLHKKYADELFRPIAPARMSIDFRLTTQDKRGRIETAQDRHSRDDAAIGRTGKSSVA